MKFFIACMILLLSCPIALAETENEALSELGIGFTAPQDWRYIKQQTSKKDPVTVKGVYYASSNNEGVITLVVSDASQSEVAGARNAFIQKYGTTPKQIIFLGVPCDVFTFEESIEKGIRRNRQYHFYKNGHAYIIAFVSLAEETIYKQRLFEFENSLTTLRISE